MTSEERLEYLRGEIKAERISYGEIAELQSLVDHIDKDDVLLLEWAGVPENPCKDKWHGEHVKPKQMSQARLNHPTQRDKQSDMQAERDYLRG